jgi:hypothetical protein
MKVSRPRIIVRDNIMNAPLLDTDKANTIEFYDQYGDLVAVFGKVLNQNYWSMSFKTDADWDQTLARMGFIGKSDVRVGG